MKKKSPTQLTTSTSLLSLSLAISSPIEASLASHDTIVDEISGSSHKISRQHPSSAELAKSLKPTYRGALHDKAKELNEDVLRRALGALNPSKALPTPDQAFGDVLSFKDSWSDGDTWRDVFADSGR